MQSQSTGWKVLHRRGPFPSPPPPSTPLLLHTSPHSVSFPFFVLAQKYNQNKLSVSFPFVPSIQQTLTNPTHYYSYYHPTNQ